MQKNEIKSSTVAGLLGVFLGWVGGHDWYLGESKKAITHVSLSVGGLILLMIGIILDNLSRNVPALNVLFICLIVVAYVILVGNLVWGMIEGVMILVQGDAGLAAKGYKVMESGAPLAMANPNENPNNADMVAPNVSVAGGTEVRQDVAPMAGAAENATPATGASTMDNVASVSGAVPTAGVVATNAGVVAGAGVTSNNIEKEDKMDTNTMSGAGAATGMGAPVSLDTTENKTVPEGAALQGGAAGGTVAQSAEAGNVMAGAGVAVEGNNASVAPTNPNGAENRDVPNGAAVQGGGTGASGVGSAQ